MSHTDLVSQFKSFYSDLLKAEWAQIDRIYARNVRFRDPIHEISGRDALHRYLDELCKGVSACRFEYLDESLDERCGYIKWNMHFSHPRIEGNRMIEVRGVSQVLFNAEGIYYQEDIYDMGAMLYEHVPLLGSGVRWLKHRMARAS
ncbi:nuclear transport factor 2 family protein [Proteobacteria bacterium 005FR1]|nr:nuclear transport factor 2 family protein [Proteobacteria bacterium 005FR1]